MSSADEEPGLERAELSDLLRAVDPVVLDDDPVYGALDEAEEAALVAGVMGRIGVSEPQPSAELVQTQVGPTATERPAWMVPAVVSALAAAAALLFFVQAPGTQPSLPEYALVMPAPDALVRGPDETSPTAEAPASYTLGRELTLYLRPAHSTDQRARVRATIVSGELVRELGVASEVTAKGVIVVRVATGPNSQLTQPVETVMHLQVFDAESGAPPDDPRTKAAGVQSHRFEFVLTPARP